MSVVAGDPRAPGWDVGDCLALIHRLLADNARLRGESAAQVRQHYALPPHPPIHRMPTEAT